MDDKNIAILLTGFVVLIVGIVLIPTIADLIIDSTFKIEVVDEVNDISGLYNVPADDQETINATIQNFTVTNAPTSWKTDACPISGVTLTNNSGTELTEDTDYVVWGATGTIQMLSTAATNYTLFAVSSNNTLIDYTYCGDTYITEGWQRTVLNLVPGFIALALLLAGIGIAYSILKKEGIAS